MIEKIKTDPHVKDFPVSEFRSKLLEWEKVNSRDFPWRCTQNPYHILIAEVLLHRTRAEQVVPLYKELISRFPSVRDLAESNFSDLRQILKSAGLNWRIRYLYDMACELIEKYEGEVPDEKQTLLSLPGVSDYIASAVRCFAFGYPEPILDTNTVRIIGRIFGIPVTDSSRRSKKFRKTMEILLDSEHPREFNFAMLDLSAKVCIKRSRPLCHLCPVRDFCYYIKEEKKDA